MNATRASRRWIAFALLLANWGCGSTPQVSGPPQQPGDATIAQAFRISEIRRGQPSGARPQSTLVDYDSAVNFIPDRGLLATLIRVGDGAGALSDNARAALDGRITELTAQLESFKSFRGIVDDIADYQQKSTAFWAAPPAGELQVDPTWQALNSAESRIVGTLGAAAKIYVANRYFGGQVDWAQASREVNDKLKEVYNPMAPPSKNGRRRFVTAAVVDFLDQANDLLTTRLKQLTDAVDAKSPPALLDMEAHLVRGEERLPVSISPYRIVEGADRGDKSRRVGLPTPKDIERVRRGYEAHAEFAKAINDLRDLTRDRAKLQQMLDQLVKALRESGKRLRDDLLTQLRLLVDDKSGEIPEIVEAAKALKKDVDALLAGFEAITEASTLDPITIAQSVTQLLGQMGSDGDVLEHIKTLADLLTKAPSNLKPEVRQLIEKAKKSVDTEKDALLQVLDGTPAISGLATALGSIRAAADTQTFGELKPGTIQANPMSLDVATAGTVDLDRTAADSGDRLEVTYRVITNPTSSVDRRTQESYASLDVRKFGYYSTFKSQILFYNRLRDDSSVYSAAPGVCYNLHYRPDGMQDFFDVVAPGLGVSVSAPNFEGGTELAIGVQATLFNDMLQVGYGYDISVDDQPYMFYFGLDLVSVFQSLK